MLAELAAANAAFAVIKTTLKNGGELVALGKQLGSYFENSSKIEKRASANGSGDMEAFLAREQLRQYEDELKELFIYQGRPGLWQDWLAFKRDAKKARDEEARRLKLLRARRKQLVVQWILVILIAAAIGTALGSIGWLVYAIKTRSM